MQLLECCISPCIDQLIKFMKSSKSEKGLCCDCLMPFGFQLVETRFAKDLYSVSTLNMSSV